MAGYGFCSHKKDEDIQEAEERARRWWDCARIIAQADPEPMLLHFSGPQDQRKKRWDEARRKGLDLEPSQFGPTTPDVLSAVQECFGLEAAGESLRGRLEKYAVEFLTGGWLEGFLWGILDRHARPLGIWDVRLGLRPGKVDPKTESEFDIGFMHNYSLSMIECKSGAQEHDPDVEILHKVEAVVRQFRALRVRSYLASTSPNINRPSIRNRADLYGCRVVVRDEIRRLAHDPDEPELVRQVFFNQQQQR